MSTSPPNGDWASNRVVPSLVFIVTPIIALLFLVVWSLRIQRMRRRYMAGLARLRASELEGGINAPDLKNIPIVHDIWLDPNEKNTLSNSPSHWNTILPVAAISEGSKYDVSTIIRMPHEKHIVHSTDPDVELQIGRISISQP